MFTCSPEIVNAIYKQTQRNREKQNSTRHPEMQSLCGTNTTRKIQNYNTFTTRHTNKNIGNHVASKLNNAFSYQLTDEKNASACIK